eukprot:1068464-Pleurochrysis_carterae.AAC.1
MQTCPRVHLRTRTCARLSECVRAAARSRTLIIASACGRRVRMRVRQCVRSGGVGVRSGRRACEMRQSESSATGLCDHAGYSVCRSAAPSLCLRGSRNT